MIGNNLKKIREENGLTQKELGEKIGASQKDISRWENEIITPSLKTIEKISSLLNITIDDIIGNENIKLKKITIRKKTIKDMFEFGFEEIIQETIIVNNNKYIYHINDFFNGKMNKFYNYTIEQFEKEFSCVLSFR